MLRFSFFPHGVNKQHTQLQIMMYHYYSDICVEDIIRFIQGLELLQNTTVQKISCYFSIRWMSRRHEDYLPYKPISHTNASPVFRTPTYIVCNFYSRVKNNVIHLQRCYHCEISIVGVHVLCVFKHHSWREGRITLQKT
jgi:hypothetical protein